MKTSIWSLKNFELVFHYHLYCRCFVPERNCQGFELLSNSSPFLVLKEVKPNIYRICWDDTSQRSLSYSLSCIPPQSNLHTGAGVVTSSFPSSKFWILLFRLGKAVCWTCFPFFFSYRELGYDTGCVKITECFAAKYIWRHYFAVFSVYHDLCFSWV